MKICPACGKDWNKTGAEYKRNYSNKIDYYCKCGSKRKPIENKYSIEIDENRIAFSNYQKYKNILCIGDLHLPFTLPEYLPFCEKIYNKYNCNHVIFMGDLIDNHYSSFHAADPDGKSAGDELDFTISLIQCWSKVFPVADVCLGNHDRIILRKAYKEGVSKRWIKDFNDVLGVNWNFKPSFEYNNVLFRHGMNMKASVKSGSEMMSVAQGHFHTDSNITWSVGRGKKVFGMQVPCGVNRETYAMAYAMEYPKQAIGCSVVLEHGRLPVIEMCDL